MHIQKCRNKKNINCAKCSFYICLLKYNLIIALDLYKKPLRGGKVFNIRKSDQIRAFAWGIVNKLFKMLRVFSVLFNQDTVEHIKSCFEVNLSWINAVQHLWQGFLKGLIGCKRLAALPSLQEDWKLACLPIKVVQDVSKKKKKKERNV